MDDVTRDPLLRALADARPASSDPTTDDMRALRARLDAARRPTAHHARTLGRVAAVATLVTAAVVSTLVLTSGSPRSDHASTPTLAMKELSYNARHAMSVAASSLIEYDQIAMSSSSGAIDKQTDMWRYGSSRRGEILDAAGNPVTDASVTTSGSSSTVTLVDYSTDQYSTTTSSNVGVVLTLADPSTLIRAELADGQLTEVGQSDLNGAPAIELEGTGGSGVNAPLIFNFAVRVTPGGTPPSTPPNVVKSATSLANSVTTVEWWVDPTTFLPMQEVVTTAPGFTITSTLNWLSPTAANLADLAAPIPAGFTETSSSMSVSAVHP